MPKVTIETRGQLEPHLSQEWLLTNGLGGFAFSTVVGCNRRRYHGLLTAATTPPVGRIVALNRIGESLILDGKTDRALGIQHRRRSRRQGTPDAVDAQPRCYPLHD